MFDFNQAINKHQRRLIAEELRRIVGTPTKDPNELVAPPTPPLSPALGTSRSDTTANETLICQVQCKRLHRTCSHVQSEVGFDVSIGMFVIISGDTKDSYDLGVVTRVYTAEQHAARQATMRPSNDKEEGEVRRILRLPSKEELALLPLRHNREESLLRECQQRAARMRLPMDVYGAEFQFDGSVMTFYYTSESRADYRELSRHMFNLCMVRVRMRKTNQCKKFVPVPFATAALQTGVTGRAI